MLPRSFPCFLFPATGTILQTPPEVHPFSQELSVWTHLGFVPLLSRSRRKFTSSTLATRFSRPTLQAGRGPGSSNKADASPRTIPRAAPKSWPFSSARMRSRRCSSSSSSFSITAAASTMPRRPRPRRAAAPGETVGEAAATGAPSAAESPPARSSKWRTLRTAWK